MLSIASEIAPMPRKHTHIRSRRIPRQAKLKRAIRRPGRGTRPDKRLDDVEGLASVDGDGRLAGPAQMLCAAGDGHLVGVAGNPGVDGCGFGCADEGEVALAWVLGGGFERGG